MNISQRYSRTPSTKQYTYTQNRCSLLNTRWNVEVMLASRFKKDEITEYKAPALKTEGKAPWTVQPFKKGGMTHIVHKAMQKQEDLPEGTPRSSVCFSQSFSSFSHTLKGGMGLETSRKNR